MADAADYIIPHPILITCHLANHFWNNSKLSPWCALYLIAIPRSTSPLAREDGPVSYTNSLIGTSLYFGSWEDWRSTSWTTGTMTSSRQGLVVASWPGALWTGCFFVTKPISWITSVGRGDSDHDVHQHCSAASHTHPWHAHCCREHNNNATTPS
jgi:hypothetical protein